jgi:hypothetical protein
MTKCYIHDLNPRYENVGLIFLDGKECTCIGRFIPRDYSLEIMRENKWWTRAKLREVEIEQGLKLQKEAIERNK